MHRNRQEPHPPRHDSVRLPARLTTIVIATALAALATLATVAGPVHAQDDIDATITLRSDAPPTCECPLGAFTNTEWDPDGRATWRIDLSRAYTVVDVEMPAGFFDTERAEQVVPLLYEPGRDYPLFGYFPRADIWNTQSHVRLFHYIETDDHVTLRLGIPGPTTANLSIERDVTPPTFTLGKTYGVTHFGFHQNTTTDEPAIGNLEWRRSGSNDEWVQNPTPEYHVKQKFPIQGMDPDTTYEVRATFTDWAGNSITSDPYQVRTKPAATGADVIVTPLSPTKGATVNATDVTIRAHLVAPDARIAEDDVRLFFDLEEIPFGFTFDGANLTYDVPWQLEPGTHVVGVEAISLAHGTGHARWTFQVAGATDETETAPAPAALALLALVAMLSVALRRRAD